MTRRTKTPAQRAQEAKHRKAFEDVQRELEPAVKRRDYLAQNPDLPAPTERTAP